jgi:hypothetical protein
MLALTAVIAPKGWAQPLGYDAIPKQMLGSWVVAGSSVCSKPGMVVAPGVPDGFRFTFFTPAKGEMLLYEGVPMPGIVGAPPAASFEPPKDPNDTKPRIARGVEVSMPSVNRLVVQFMKGGTITQYARCSGPQVG